MRKKFFFILLTIVLTFLIYNFSAVRYGIQQGLGQATVLWNAQPIAELMQQANFPDSIKQKFTYIQEVKQFAEDSLGLKPTENYSSFYDQKGQPILWVVTASPEFEIEAKEWCFPFAGCFPYKGFFDLSKAEKEEEKLKEEGWDTEIDEVNAWSTLGWFEDPILSSMLQRSEGRLAELIIHESTHATLYVKDSVQFNENLASFIGKKGAERFLDFRFGKGSTERKKYLNDQKRNKTFKKYMQSALSTLDSLYNNLDFNLSLENKRTLKQQWIRDLKFGLLKTDYYEDKEIGKKRMEKFKPNNAYFSGFRTYSMELPFLEMQLNKKFKGNLKNMIDFFEKKYESL